MMCESIFWNAWKAILLLTIISSMIGFLTLDTGVIVLIAVALFPKITLHLPTHTPRSVWLLGVIAAAIASIPAIRYFPMVDGSADIFHVIFVRVLQASGSIPATLSPYADYPLAYPIGFHALAVHFTSFFPASDYIVLAAMGIFFVFSMTIFLYHFFKTAGATPHQALWGPALLLGTTMIYFNQYTGLYPALLASVLGLWSFSSVIARDKQYPLPLLAMWVVHPGVGIYITWMLVTFLVWNGRGGELKRVIPYAILALPLVPFLRTILTENTHTIIAGIAPPTIPFVWQAVNFIVMHVGYSCMIVLSGVIAYFIYRRAENKLFHFFLAHVLLSLVVMLALIFLEIPLANQSGLYHKVSEYTLFAAIGTVVFSSLTARPLPKRVFAGIIFLVLVAGLAASAGNEKLNYFREPGDKITVNEAQFAREFRDFDPRVKSVFYFSEHGSKISEYANKSPFDYSQSFFVPPYAFPADVNREESTLPIFSNHQEWEKIVRERCGECVNATPAHYVVAPVSWNITTHTPVFVANGIAVYRTPI